MSEKMQTMYKNWQSIKKVARKKWVFQIVSIRWYKRKIIVYKVFFEVSSLYWILFSSHFVVAASLYKISIDFQKRI